MDIGIAHSAQLSIEIAGDRVLLHFAGDWVVESLGKVDAQLRKLREVEATSMTFDLTSVSRLDTAGAFVMHRTRKQAVADGLSVEIVGSQENFDVLLGEVGEHDDVCEVERPEVNGLLLSLDRVGRAIDGIYRQGILILGLSGQVLYALGQVILNPRRFRIVSFITHMEKAGLDAVPIVSLLTFLIGAVMAFLGAKTLRSLGGEVFVVELVSIGVLRELGVILAAIITAGRSGSAFTAEIGSMKSNEEIDAMRTIGINPIDVLVLPRVMAFVFMLPVLTFIGDVMGIFGGMLVSWLILDLSPAVFFGRMVDLVALDHFWVGLIKAPFFAWAVAVIGCFEGLDVEGSAESVGRHTTRSVVQAIFVVIVLDAMFAMLFMEIDF